MAKKELIKLTESDLHNIIKESVNKVLKEAEWDFYMKAAQKANEIGKPEQAKRLESGAQRRFAKKYPASRHTETQEVPQGYFQPTKKQRVEHFSGAMPYMNQGYLTQGKTTYDDNGEVVDYDNTNAWIGQNETYYGDDQARRKKPQAPNGAKNWNYDEIHNAFKNFYNRKK